jgi:hypothetical protein
MPHAFLAVNPFNVMLQLHQSGQSIDSHFSFWLRAYCDPPVRTVSALIEKCPRLDWLYWFFEHSARLEYVDTILVLDIGLAVRPHLDKIKDGRNYTKIRAASPHAEGLRVLKAVLVKERFWP